MHPTKAHVVTTVGFDPIRTSPWILRWGFWMLFSSSPRVATAWPSRRLRQPAFAWGPHGLRTRGDV